MLPDFFLYGLWGRGCMLCVSVQKEQGEEGLRDVDIDVNVDVDEFLCRCLSYNEEKEESEREKRYRGII